MRSGLAFRRTAAEKRLKPERGPVHADRSSFWDTGHFQARLISFKKTLPSAATTWKPSRYMMLLLLKFP